MSGVLEKLDYMIDECESRIAEAKRQLRVLQAELEGYQRARETLRAVGVIRRRSDEEHHSRPLSDAWKRILAFVAAKQKEGASIDEIEAFKEEAGFKINRNTIRSQLSIYNSKGLLERISSSRYRATDTALSLILQEPNDRPRALSVINPQSNSDQTPRFDASSSGVSAGFVIHTPQQIVLNYGDYGFPHLKKVRLEDD